MLNQFEKPVVVAAFDFDNTLTDQDSFLPFLFFSTGFWKTTVHLLALMPSFIAYLLDTYPRERVKEDLLKTFFKNMSYNEFDRAAQQYAETKLNHYVKPIALQKLKWHKMQGHFCVLVSAAPEPYLKYWGDKHGFDATLGTRIEISPDGRVTGKLKGPNCWGPEKVSRLVELLGPKDYELYAYGDSEGDKELLEYADYPFYRKFY